MCLAGRYSRAVERTARGEQTAYARALALQDDGAEIADVGPLLRQAKRELAALIDRAVEEAAFGNRQRTWSEIGRSLGISRQAVQQKYDR